MEFDVYEYKQSDHAAKMNEAAKQASVFAHFSAAGDFNRVVFNEKRSSFVSGSSLHSCLPGGASDKASVHSPGGSDKPSLHESHSHMRERKRTLRIQPRYAGRGTKSSTIWEEIHGINTETPGVVQCGQHARNPKLRFQIAAARAGKAALAVKCVEGSGTTPK